LAFGLPVCGANALSWLVLNVDYVVIGHTAGSVTLGFYVLAFNISSWPVNALLQAVRNVALPGFARLDGAESAKSFVSSFSLVLTAGLLIAALLAPLAVPAVTFVYGARWLRSAGALGVLAVFGAMRIVFDLMATFLIARGGSRQVLLIQVGWVAALAPAMVVGVRAWGIVGAGIAHLTIAVIVVLPAYVLVLRRYGVSLRPLVRAATPPVAAALITGLAVWGCSKAVGGASYALAVGGSLGVVAYLLLLFRWLRGRLSGGLPAPAEA
jgi:O-antigen/teichoic acid export membrane protein